jgi:hypothetical protein
LAEAVVARDDRITVRYLGIEVDDALAIAGVERLERSMTVPETIDQCLF